MTTHADPRIPGAPESSAHACAQCKASKKKCDKALPSCNRCSRLILSCIYDDGAGIAPAEIISKFQAVFNRLERLEENVFAPTAATNATPTPSISLSARPTDLEADKWQISPQLLQPSYLEVIAGANVFKLVEDMGMTMRGVVQKYFNTMHSYMPIISRVKIDKQVQGAETLNSTGAFMVLFMAIVLLTECPTAHSNNALDELYQVCKYHFSLFLSLKDPTIELIQAGLFITLYEYAHCMTEQAYITIGACSRMASLLRLHYNAGSASQSALAEDSFDESAHVIMAIQLLDRHIYLSFTMLGKHLSSEYSPSIVASKPPEISGTGRDLDSLRCEAEACRILCRLQQVFHEESPEFGLEISGPTQLDRIIALDDELRSIKLDFQDYNNSLTWRGEFAAYAVASLSVFNFLSHQEETAAATWYLGQRHVEILASTEMLVWMVKNQLSKTVGSEDTAAFPSPLSMSILALGANSLKSLRSAEISEECLSSQTKVFTDLLRCLGARWGLGNEYLKTMGLV